MKYGGFLNLTRDNCSQDISMSKNIYMEKDQMISIFENSTIFLKNGVKQFHEAILVTTKGIYTGTLKKSDEREGEFEEHCFIPRDQIEKITIVNEHGKIKEIEL